MSAGWRFSFRRRTLLKLTVASFPPVAALYLMYYLLNAELPQQVRRRPIRPRPPVDPRYVMALRSQSDDSGFVVLAMVDESFVDMAANLYESSFRPHGIKNFLFVGVGRRACPLLANMSLPCFSYADDPSASRASQYGTQDFVRKSNIRTRIVLDALEANFTVLHTDVDVAFFSNPLPELKDLMKVVHLSAMWDHGALNAGFLVVRPSELTQRIYNAMWRIAEENPSIDDQSALSSAVNDLKKKHRQALRQRTQWNVQQFGVNPLSAVTSLDRRRFLCGIDYFEKPTMRGHPQVGAEWNPTDVCGKTFSRVRASRACADVVHNNWIVGRAAKTFRFREHMMWSYDPDGTYYAGRDAMYLTFSTAVYGTTPVPKRPSPPPPPSPRSRRAALGASQRAAAAGWWRAAADSQMAQLKTAMAFGHVLNRTVILPRFYCSVGTSADCPLNALLDVASFDRQFAGRYRESSFLHNKKVPGDVRRRLSQKLRCRTPLSADGGSTVANPVHGGVEPQQPASVWSTTDSRLTSGDILRMFGKMNDRVLVFEPFVDADCFPVIDDRNDREDFERRIEQGFIRNNYRQLNRTKAATPAAVAAAGITTVAVGDQNS